MILTEAEAKEKWCPQARVVSYSSNDGTGVPPAGNRCIMQEDPTRALNGAAICIGSKCMLWRWHVSPEQARINHQYNAGGIVTPKGYVLPEEAKGYCGLAVRS